MARGGRGEEGGRSVRRGRPKKARRRTLQKELRKRAPYRCARVRPALCAPSVRRVLLRLRSRMLGQLGYSCTGDPKTARRHARDHRARQICNPRPGCGTGLGRNCVPRYRLHAHRPRSGPGNDHKARARGIYDKLEVSDLETALGADERAVDLMIAADTLVYLGDLGAVFAGAAHRLLRAGFSCLRSRDPDRKFRTRPQAPLAALAGLSACGCGSRRTFRHRPPRMLAPHGSGCPGAGLCGGVGFGRKSGMIGISAGGARPNLSR